MIVVITPEQVVEKELRLLHQMLDNGLEHLHIRMYQLTEHEMRHFIESIDVRYREQLVLHAYFDLAADHGIRRLHLSSTDRGRINYEAYKDDHVLSTSVHSIEEFNGLSPTWDYAFLSPVFPSISKPGYGRDRNVLNDIRKREKGRTRLVGLGGVAADNFEMLIKAGADGAALLGGIWQNEDPLKTFKQCQQIDRSY